ncbi:hypothetical protein GGH92_009771, partial [Coemansia sp. RSA 2673]
QEKVKSFILFEFFLALPPFLSGHSAAGGCGVPPTAKQTSRRGRGGGAPEAGQANELIPASGFQASMGKRRRSKGGQGRARLAYLE